MNYITDYQLDIDRGFMCKVNGITYQFDFKYSTRKYLYYVSNILKLADFLEIDRSELKGIFNNETAYDVIYCDSKQECYDLCQHIVDTYFKLDPFTKNDEEFTVEINGNKHKFFLTKNVMFYWDSKTINAFHFNDHISLTEIVNICTILKIDKYKHHNNKIGFETKEDAIKFAKYVIQYHYPRKETKECNEKSRRHLLKYYSADESFVILNGKKWTLIWEQERDTWYFYNEEHGYHTYFKQFGINNAKHAIDICSNLGLLAKFTQKLEFESRQDAIKFTDYLIETYIIKKEKTYDTNRLRKERTSLSRGAKPAGSIIHGRRSKASIRCRHIEYKARIGC